MKKERFDLSDLDRVGWLRFWDEFKEEYSSNKIERLIFKFDPNLIEEDIKGRIILSRIPGLIAYSIKPLCGSQDDLTEYLELFIFAPDFIEHHTKDTINKIMKVKI